MAIITVEDVQCPTCEEVFDADDLDSTTEEDDPMELDCPECGLPFPVWFEGGKLVTGEYKDGSLDGLVIDVDPEEPENDEEEE